MGVAPEEVVEEHATEVGDDNAKDGWADAMAKVLVKQGPKDVPSLILAKVKTALDDNVEEKVDKNEKRQKLDKKRKWEQMNYVKPVVLEKDFEKSLQKTATKGVVQLFNAVKKHQKELDEKLKNAKTESKKDKVIGSINKGKFLDMLKGDKSAPSKPTNNDDEEEKPAWSVLRDDFMLGNDMKDWDKQSDDDNDDENASKT